MSRSLFSKSQIKNTDHEIVDRIFVLLDSFKEHFVEALASVDLPIPLGHLLMNLEEPTAMSELARCMGFDASHITSIVDRLEERKLVERQADVDDRRIKLIAITQAGEKLRDQIRERLLETLPPLTKLTQEQRKQLRDLLVIATSSTVDG